MNEQPVLVTGAAGFVGGHLLDLLLPQATPVVGWHRPTTAASALHPQVRWMPIELLDRDAVKRAIAEVNPAAIYHLAGAAHVAQSWQYTLETYQGNVLATHHLFEGLRAARLRPRVLISGSATIYRPQNRPLREDDPLGPASPYATSKAAQEMLACRVYQDDGVPVVIARAFNHVGPRQDPSYVAPGIARQIALIEAGRQEPVLTMGSLDPIRDITDVRDTVRAYVAMMKDAQPGRPYNVCSGRELSIRRLVETFASRARVPVRVVQDRNLFRANDAPLLVGDHGRLTADTGWMPRIPFEQTVDDLLAYWRDRI
jgi:GDP-4-dehydro-6-deoxy-D-mannose reductase